ncbi:MAG TPA: ISNCY family transposase [Pyrinomonadaceae bacterium]|nr:ISNCY family transposase [Pyrinomonadaceae bacterium]
MKERKRIAEATAGRYRKAGKKERGAILNEFVELTGFARSYAALVLRNQGRVVPVSRQLRVRGDVGEKLARPGRGPTYDEQTVKVLIQVWRIMDYICGKRLAPVLGEMVERLLRHNELRCDATTSKKLARMSAATIDRLLRPERQKYQLKGRTHTRPGTLLKHQIPMRTFTEWDDQQPGFLEIDLVGHDGGVLDSHHAFTLNAVDIASGWNCSTALQNKAQVWTLQGVAEIRAKLPFPLLGIDSDNGSEFINESLYNYCRDHKITFTRSRPYRKNDSCFVEQKNYSVVRRAVGYQRFDSDEQLRLLNQLYEKLDLYTNFFQPSLKLKSKERHGARVTKKYHEARTPYQRLLDSSFIKEQTKQLLRDRYYLLNPAQLKRQIERLQQKLLATAVSTTKTRKRPSDKRRPAKPAVEMARLRKAPKRVASLKRLGKSGKKAA